MNTAVDNTTLREAPHPAVNADDPIPMLSFDAEEERHDTGTWQLIHDDIFDRIQSDEELYRVLDRLATRLSSPYAELMRRLLGMEIDETEARTFFRKMLDHRDAMSDALGRPIHVRVAALDLLTSGGGRGRHPSRPILVMPDLLERALEEASADALTGLPQRGYFTGILRHELRQRHRRSVVVVFLDLDGMKRVNDVHGHARGDDILRSLAASGRAVLRQGDVLARIGGDEFAIMLVDVSVAEAAIVVGRLRDNFEAATAGLGTSFSAGIELADEKESAEEIIARADAGMYRDKRGRAAGR